MGSNGLPINTIPATSAAMTGAHAPPGTAADTDGDQAAAAAATLQAAATAAPAAGLDLLPATLADLAASLRAIRFELAEIKAGQHPPPPSAAVPAVSATPPPPASIASKVRPAFQWPASPSPIPTDRKSVV